MAAPPEQPAVPQGKLGAHELDLIVRRLDSLPALPVAAGRLLELTAPDGRGGAVGDVLAEATRVVAADCSLAARVLAAANATAPVAARTVAQAVAMLDVAGLRAVALSTRPLAVAATGDPADMPLAWSAFWRHCVAVGAAARMLAERANIPLDGDEAFTAGLLHDIGKLALAEVLPKSYARALATARTRRAALADCERELLGLDHCMVGRRLARRWRLGPRVTDAIWLHHQPGGAAAAPAGDPAMARLVGLADAIARRERVGSSGNPAPPRLAEAALRSLGISQEHVDEVAECLAGRAEELLSPLRLDHPEAAGAGGGEALARANAELGRLNEQLRRRGEVLAAQARALRRLGSFAESLTPEAEVADVLQRVAEVFLAARAKGAAAPGAVVCYSLDVDGRSMLAVRYGGAGRPAWRAFALAGESADLLPAAGAGESLDRLLADAGEFSAWVDLPDCGHQPLQCAGRWLGGVLYPPGQVEEACRPLADALGMALGIVQRSCRAEALSEELAAASRELAETQEALAEARTIEAVGDLAAGAAHELNNPLAVVSGRAQLMAARARSERQRRIWELIAEQAQRISDIISELMDFASPPEPRLEAVDPAALLAAAAETFSSGDHPQAANSRVDIEVGDDCPAIRADRAQMQGVIVELMTNAATAATSTPHIRLAAELDEIGDAVLLTVQDDGPGMDEDTASRACTPFFSAQAAGRRRGLGLPRARRHVEGNGGRIWIDSRPGEGTTVSIRLPPADTAGERGRAVT